MKPYNTCQLCRAVIDDPETFCHRCESRRMSKKIVNVCGWLAVACIVIAIYGPRSCHGSPIYASHMQAIAIKESGNNPMAIGKAKELGKYQLKAVAVKEVNRIEGTKWKHSHCLDPELSDYIAYAYMKICMSRTKDKSVASAYRVYRGLK